MAEFYRLDHFSYSLLLLFAVLLCKVILTRLLPHRPLQTLQHYCAALARKVNKSGNSPQQQLISGSIATLITIGPLLLMLALFENLVAIPMLWQGLLLYLALDGFELTGISKQTAQLVNSGQNYQAKQLLQPWLLRQTTDLSGIGLNKACIEMQLLRTVQQLFTVACIYLLLGPLAALSYRLLLELHYGWNIKRARFAQFGLTVHKAVALCEWLPGRLFSLLLLLTSLSSNTLLFLRLLKPNFFLLNNDLPMQTMALLLGCKLGGVAMYDGVKLRRSAFNDLGHQPEPRDIILAGRRIRQVLTFCLVMLLLALLLRMLTR